uniref:G-protein coupled receptors family 1 profile domain-containing protein n=1 Tax=Angiostrongylus cantonensis TaxID=6313 RepID=A0A0K0DGD2_ANGCA
MNTSGQQDDLWAVAVEHAPNIIPTVILYFEVVGLFGNVNLIFATIREKNLHTKHGKQRQLGAPRVRDRFHVCVSGRVRPLRHTSPYLSDGDLFWSSIRCFNIWTVFFVVEIFASKNCMKPQQCPLISSRFRPAFKLTFPFFSLILSHSANFEEEVRKNK